MEIIKIPNIKKDYTSNKEAKVGTMITCPYCGKKFKKKTYNNAFCSTTCKDKYHNFINEDRRYRQKNFWERVKQENANIKVIYKQFE